MKTYTPDELKVILDAHYKWLKGQDGGERADLSLANLSSADLSSANLSSANLRSANLRSANLSSANLRSANLSFSSANLRSANLRSANLSSANLRSANLSSADLSSANLSSADLSLANLSSANLSSANLSSANLRSANLRSANLSLANLSSANLSSANLSLADLSSANLSSADLRLANLSSVRNDIWAVLSYAPLEVPALITALNEGRVNGSAYSDGACGCLVGTLAIAAGADPDNDDACNVVHGLEGDSSRPAECFFMSIRKGDTPETNQVSKLARDWAVEWYERVSKAFGSVEAVGA
jgi:hypothetical protein